MRRNVPILIVAVFLSAAADRPDDATPESKPVFLQMANRERPRIARDRATFDALVKATADRDAAAVDKLISGKSVIQVPTGTPATSKARGAAGRLVAIDSGPQVGAEGWAEERFIREAKPVVRSPREDAPGGPRRTARTTAPEFPTEPTRPRTYARTSAAATDGPAQGGAGPGGRGHYCGAPTRKGTPCQRWVVNSVHCWQHGY
jgi:hypothetical protein